MCWNPFRRIRQLVLDVLDNQETIMAALEDLQREVQETKTVTQSAITLLRGLKKALDEAIAANQQGDPTKLAALSASLDQDQAELAAAVVANTPANSEPPPPPVEPDPNAPDPNSMTGAQRARAARRG